MFSLILIILSIISLTTGLFFVRPDSNKKTLNIEVLLNFKLFSYLCKSQKFNRNE